MNCTPKLKEVEHNPRDTNCVYTLLIVDECIDEVVDDIVDECIDEVVDKNVERIV